MVSSTGKLLRKLYSVMPCITDPPGVDKRMTISLTCLFTRSDNVAIRASVVAGTISAENDMYTRGGIEGAGTGTPGRFCCMARYHSELTLMWANALGGRIMSYGSKI